MENYGGHKLGATYLSHYWNQKFTVIVLHEPNENRGWFVSVKWEDGSTTTHCTELTSRDKEVA